MVKNRGDNMDNKEKPSLILKKNADKSLNRILLPKMFIEKFGYQFNMEVYEDKIILLPVRKEK